LPGAARARIASVEIDGVPPTLRDPLDYLGWVLGLDIVPADSKVIGGRSNECVMNAFQDTEPQPDSDSTEVGIGWEQD
jgi:hypothetical protein